MKVFVVGGVGLGAEICDALMMPGSSAHQLIGIYDDDQRLRRAETDGVPYLGTVGDLLDGSKEGAAYILGLDDNLARIGLARELEQRALNAFSFCHPMAVVSGQAEIQPGAYIAPYAFIGPRTVIGRHVVVNVSASVGFGSNIEDLAQICPGARISRSCRIGEGAFIGSNAIIAPGITVGARARVAAGSFIFRNVPANKMAMGVPGRLLEG